MPNFLESIFTQLKRAGDRVVLREVQGEAFTSVTGQGIAGAGAARARIHSKIWTDCRETAACCWGEIQLSGSP